MVASVFRLINCRIACSEGYTNYSSLAILGLEQSELFPISISCGYTIELTFLNDRALKKS